MITERIGFIGAGQMARALAQGITRAGLVDEDRIMAHDPVIASGKQFLADVSGAHLATSNDELVRQTDIVVIAVKPQSLSSVTDNLGPISGDKLLVSILAGVSLATLCNRFSSERIVRVMPNTPCLLGVGASGYASGPGATPEDGALVGNLLRSVGIAFEVEEPLLDGVTGLSGSGPAYVYTLIEALSDGGVQVGLPRAMATALAAQTVLGAATMVLATSEHTGVLRDRVTSPGGTTMAGLQVLEQHGLRAALMNAVEAATSRSRELGGS
ncbi:MAG: pyrroline-5-carboxylate reductase [Pirellulaceae bacterium]